MYESFPILEVSTCFGTFHYDVIYPCVWNISMNTQFLIYLTTWPFPVCLCTRKPIKSLTSYLPNHLFCLPMYLLLHDSWEVQMFSINHTTSTYSHIFRIPFITIQDTKLQSYLSRLINRIILCINIYNYCCQNDNLTHFC